jgi:hypothetical protein
VTNLTIANIFLFLSILCLAISAQLMMPLFFIYSMVAVTLAGALRYDQLPHDEKPRRGH